MTKDGRVLDLVVSAISHRDTNGKVDGMLIASKDVTERLRAERELRTALAENASLRKELERERDYLREEVNVAMNFGRIIGTSPRAAKNAQSSRGRSPRHLPASCCWGSRALVRNSWRTRYTRGVLAPTAHS